MNSIVSMDEILCLRDFDEMLDTYRDAGCAPSVKDLETLRAKFVLTLAPYRDRPLIYPPILEPLEVE